MASSREDMSTEDVERFRRGTRMRLIREALKAKGLEITPGVDGDAALERFAEEVFTAGFNDKG